MKKPNVEFCFCSLLSESISMPISGQVSTYFDARKLITEFLKTEVVESSDTAHVDRHTHKTRSTH